MENVHLELIELIQALQETFLAVEELAASSAKDLSTLAPGMELAQ